MHVNCDNSCVSRAVCSSFIVQTRCADMKPFVHFEREKQKARGEPHRKFSNYFISYLKKKYELYLTFSIIIILHAPDRVWDCAKPLREDSLRSVYENSF